MNDTGIKSDDLFMLITRWIDTKLLFSTKSQTSPPAKIVSPHSMISFV